MSDLILYQFSRDRVEAGDAKDFLSRFGNSQLPKGKKLEGMMNSVARRRFAEPNSRLLLQPP